MGHLVYTAVLHHANACQSLHAAAMARAGHGCIGVNVSIVEESRSTAAQRKSGSNKRRSQAVLARRGVPFGCNLGPSCQLCSVRQPPICLPSARGNGGVHQRCRCSQFTDRQALYSYRRTCQTADSSPHVIDPPCAVLPKSG